MNQSTTLAVVGGDVRQAYLAELLHEAGHTVRTFALERRPAAGCTAVSDLQACLDDARAVILPMPVQMGDGSLNAPLANAQHTIGDVLDAIPAGTLTLAGAVPFSVHARAVQNGLTLIDYLSREELAIRNAVPAAFAKSTAGFLPEILHESRTEFAVARRLLILCTRFTEIPGKHGFITLIPCAVNGVAHVALHITAFAVQLLRDTVINDLGDAGTVGLPIQAHGQQCTLIADRLLAHTQLTQDLGQPLLHRVSPTGTGDRQLDALIQCIRADWLTQQHVNVQQAALHIGLTADERAEQDNARIPHLILSHP